jgi:TonB family protein
MAVVYREANWGAQVGTAARQSEQNCEKASRQGAAEPNRTTTITTANAARSNRDVEYPTIEIAIELTEARDVTVVAVTTDEELRSALSEVLPKGSTIFANSPEQVLTRPVPNSCAVLIVEQTLNRSTLDQLKSHLKASAPALVSIMVGTDDNGSSLVARLSAGHIDRFMVKPFKLGPTRSALRSALQQHHSLRQCAQVERTTKAVTPAESALGAAPSPQGKAKRDEQVHAMQSEKEKIAVAVKQPVVAERYKAEQHRAKLKSDLEDADEIVEPTRGTRISQRTVGATTARRFSLPSWIFPFAAAFAALALVAFSISTRTPELNKDKVIAGHLSAAHRAFELGSYVDPPELSAAHFYSAALELDPTSVQAKHGLEAVADRLITAGKELIIAGDLLRAQSTLDSVRRIQPDHRELADVTASLLNAREAERVTLQAAHSASKENLEPIAPAQVARAVLPASSVVGRTSVSTVPKVKNSPQRSETLVLANSAAIGTVGVSSSSKSFEKVSATNHATNHATAATDSLTLNQASLDSADREQGRLLESSRLEAVHGEAAMLAAPSVASVPAKNSTDAVIGNESGSNDARPTNAGQMSTGSVSMHPVATTEARGSPIGNPMTSAADGEARLVKYVAPVYPSKARAENAEGWVIVRFLVTSDGSVISPHIEKGSLEPSLRRAALAAVTQWKYSPAATGATPNRPMIVRLKFQLADSIQTAKHT